MPTRLTVFYWQNRIPGFAARMLESRAAGHHCIADQILDSADEKVDKDDVPAKRLSFEKKKWFLSKRSPEIYGDKQEIKVDAMERALATGSTPLYGGRAPLKPRRSST